MKLMIIEGSGKIKSINKNLNDNSFKIFATGGHIKELSKDLKDNNGYGFDFNNFDPVFKTINNKFQVIKEMNELGNEAEVIYIASDPDREGEGIAWHVYNALNKNNKDKCKRITFEEINKESIIKAINNPRKIDMNLVNAQLTRQIFDKLFGYKASSFAYNLMKMKDLSIGRVQSEALQIIVNREYEIRNYVPKYWWTINPIIDVNNTNIKLSLIENEKINTKFSTIEEINKFIEVLDNSFEFIKHEIKEVYQRPHLPFDTASFLEYAMKKFNINAQKTQSLLQVLYEQGLITYPRTDSIRIDEEFCNIAYEFVKNTYGMQYANNSFWFNKIKQDDSVQEGHNALRIVNIKIRSKEQLIQILKENNVKEDTYSDLNLFKVYKAIYDRTLEAFFNAAKYNQTILTFKNNLKSEFNTLNEVLFDAKTKILVFDGWMKYYENNFENLELDKDEEQVIKVEPILNNYYEIISNKNMNDFIEKHCDKKPKRFNDGSLIKYLKQKGIGRPSTFALMVSINNQRHNTEVKNKEIVPLDKGFILDNFNKKCFSEFINDEFTAGLETQLDCIATGRLDWKMLLKKYYDEIETQLKKLNNDQSIHEEYEKELYKLANYNCPICNAKVFIKKDKNNHDYEVCENFKYNQANSCTYIKFLNNFKQNTFEKCPKCNKVVYIYTTKNKKKYKACEDYNYDATKRKCDYIEWITSKVTLH